MASSAANDKNLRDGFRHLTDRATAGKHYVYALTPEQAAAVLAELERLRRRVATLEERLSERLAP